MGFATRQAWSTGETITAAKLNANEQAPVDVINGNLDDSNMASNANIDGSKLKDDSITGSKVKDKEIIGTKIANDPADDTKRAIGNDHIHDATIAISKLKNVVIEDYAFSLVNAGGNRYFTGFQISLIEDSVTHNYKLRAAPTMGLIPGSGNVVFLAIIDGLTATLTIVPVTPIPVATKFIVDIQIIADNAHPFFVTNANTSGIIRIISADKI